MRKREVQGTRSGRRAFLAGVGTVGLGTTAVGNAVARPVESRGYPPRRHTEWGETKELGNGEVQTFVTTKPSGKTTFVGTQITADAATIDEGEYKDPTLVAIDFPGDTAFEWLGLNWMVGGHGPPEVYGVPHFDIHFYLMPETDVFEIPAINYPPGSGEPYDVELAADQFPSNHFRTQAVVENMGEHLFDAEAPEWDQSGVPSGEAFTHSFVWGHWEGDLHFFEPMITTEFFEGLEGEVVSDISMPERMPVAGQYPTAYEVAYHDDRDAYTVTLESFKRFERSET